MQPYCIEIYVSDAGMSVAVEPSMGEEQGEQKGTPVQDVNGVIAAVQQIIENGGSEANQQAEGEFDSGFGGSPGSAGNMGGSPAAQRFA